MYTLKEISPSSGRDLDRFIKFPETLYRDCPNWVPPLHFDERNNLGEGNAALEFCERKYYMVYDGGCPAGRVAAIINHKANEKWGEKTVRFGWIDFIESREVASMLIEAVEKWGREKGCTRIKGPLGFSDMDKEGLLVEGFEYLSPFSVIYNYPYYCRFLEELGFSKEADWTQEIITIPDKMPRIAKIARLAEEKYGLHMLKCRSTKEFGRKYGQEIFRVCNEAFSNLYEFTPLSEKQIRSYAEQYIPVTVADFIQVVLDKDDNIAGFAFCTPSLSKAFRKANGKLFPFGALHILHSLHHNDSLDALMIGVLPKYQDYGASALLFDAIHTNMVKHGIKTLVVNPKLEDNSKVQTLFSKGFEINGILRRRCYVKELKK